LDIEMDVFDFIAEKTKKGEPVILATVVGARGSSPAEPGKKMAIAADGTSFGTVGGGPLEVRVMEEAGAALIEKKPRLLHFRLDAAQATEKGMLCGGEQDVFLDVIAASPRLIIFGGGHVGLALARVAEAIGFPYSVVDDRAEFVAPERFPRARSLFKISFESGWDELGIDADSFLVILTRGHSFDQLCLEKALSTPARYIGMIGSRRKVEKIFSALEGKGIQIREDRRVYAPMGLHLGDKSPEEIAISIMAEIIAVKSGGTGRFLRDLRGEKDLDK